ncbi:hypothetical protein BZB76_1754 [Actinomadura pelletieri DSM 43383]|uniref:Uncharacterized protein n=1 Tax=Actinomadura pelletieri DSM 43383 TaxID=1120940 RepID=A0A495QSB5_9ACTN|nr:ABC transporter permease [Actinomadura pelletieri]RKS76399.1 hypothetical protein BZB76_1754 [Actinomadura pelletieri DSM 43383]
MRMFWTEVRRSPLRWLFPVLVCIDLAALFGRDTYWIGVWPQASAAAQIPSLFFGPALAASATWAAGRAHRHGFAEQLRASALPSWRPEIALLACTLAYGMLAYGVGVAAATVVSLPDAGSGFLWPGYVLLGMGNVVGCAAVGHAIGRWARSAFMAPVCCGIGVFVLLGLFGQSLGLFVLSGHPQVEVVDSALTTRLVLAAAITGLALLIPLAAAKGTQRWRSGLMPRLTAAGICVGLVVVTYEIALGASLQTERAAPAEPLCSKGTPRVCVWPEDRKYLPELEKMANRLASLPSDRFKVPSTFMEAGLGEDKYAGFQIIEGSMWSVSPNMASSVLQETVKPYCPAANQAAEDRHMRATFELTIWLEAWANNAGQPASVGGGPPGVDLRQIGALVKQPETTQFQWAKQRIDQINGTPCA